MPKKYYLAFVPTLLCGCARRADGRRANALSLGFEQARTQEVDRKEDLQEYPPGTLWCSIICCNCKKEGVPTHIAAFQRLDPKAVDITTITDMNLLGRWVCLAITEVEMGFTGISLN